MYLHTAHVWYSVRKFVTDTVQLPRLFRCRLRTCVPNLIKMFGRLESLAIS